MLLVLPYIEHGTEYAGYDLRFPYNDIRAPGNQIVAKSVVQIFQCPTNPLSNLRFNNAKTDSQGYGIADYTSLPYVEQAAVAGGGTIALAPTAMTGAMYPGTFYHKFIVSGSTGDNGRIPDSKSVQLDTTTTGGYNTVLGTPSGGASSLPLTGANSVTGGGQAGNKIDAMYGLPRIADITDGTANSILLYEDVGRNEQMDGIDVVAPYVGTPFPNEYLDPLNSEQLGTIGTWTKRVHWRFADPDTASGMKQKLNNSKGGSMNTADPNITSESLTNPCVGHSWHCHDCGANNEGFSFHGNGAHIAFADGHVVFMREGVTQEVLRALGTRNNRLNELGIDYDADR